MDNKLACEIIDCLPKERTVYRYYENKYAVELLRAAIGGAAPIKMVQKSRFAKLLARPPLKHIIAAKGDGMLTAADLWSCEAVPQQEYVLTLGLWGDMRKSNSRYWQTSRRGVNLVLQLNFSRRHDRDYARLLETNDDELFQYWGHPICRKGRNTLAWARIDLDFDADEALIEEIQSDWVRVAAEYEDNFRRSDLPSDRDRQFSLGYCHTVPRKNAERYFKQTLGPHRLIWADVMLSATLWFLTKEIGLKQVWYHDHDTGAVLKQITGARPPRSLYTDLPKRFCFDQVDDMPSFIDFSKDRAAKRWQKQHPVKFWRLELRDELGA